MCRHKALEGTLSDVSPIHWQYGAIARLEPGQSIDALNIVGGGIQNKLLNQMVADSINRPVVTGPVEGAAIGNLLVQMIEAKEFENLQAARDAIRCSFEIKEVNP